MKRSFVKPEFGVFSFRVYGLDDAYPAVPMPMGAAENMSLPSVPGVYFFWGDAFSGGRGVVYVGKAINLANRVRLGAHHALKDWHHVSYLMMTREVIHYAEAYYIATLRPPLNVANYFQPEGGGSHAKQMKGRLPRKSDAV